MKKGIDYEIEGGLKIIVPEVKSRPVEWKDLLRVFIDSCKIKIAMFSAFPGRYPKSSSISHCQIEGDDPLRFFVVDKQGSEKIGWYFNNRIFPARTIINPKILEYYGGEIENKEGCMSFPFSRTIKIRRWEIVLAEYWTIWGKKRKKLYLWRSFVFQHELEHMDLTHPREKYERNRKK